MNAAEQLPEELRNRICADLEPVEPLKAPWKRVALALPIVIVLILGPLFLWDLRPDLSRLGPLLSWVPLGIQLLLGSVLIALALRETIPGWHSSRLTLAVFGGLVVTVHLGVNYLVYLRSPTHVAGVFDYFWRCFRFQAMIGLPVLVLNAWLAIKALPLRPKLAGFLGGVAAGILAEASWRLVCAVSMPSHVFLAHGGAILGLGLLGVSLGWLWERICV